MIDEVQCTSVFFPPKCSLQCKVGPSIYFKPYSNFISSLHVHEYPQKLDSWSRPICISAKYMPFLSESEIVLINQWYNIRLLSREIINDHIYIKEIESQWDAQYVSLVLTLREFATWPATSNMSVLWAVHLKNPHINFQVARKIDTVNLMGSPSLEP